ncbi:MAG: thioredoxin [Microscillaceae bacterium]|jgi:thioredoxin 1|nr:thioredoxin [Microscillaceae bacterium]
MGNTLEVTDQTFAEVVKNSDKTVLVDFWAEWCGPCKMLSPIVEELAVEFGDQAVIAKVNVDDNMLISQEFNIRSIPTLLFFKNGEVVDKQVGYVPKNVLKQKLEANL